ncbi:MAG: hypothetical protein ACKOYN_11420, partial [Planctomycetota bacterium]
PAVPTNATVRARVEGETAIVELEATDEAGANFATNLDPEAASIGPTGEVKQLNVVQTGPGRWRAEFPVTEAGAYLVNFALGKSADGRRSNVQASVSVPYPKEFRTVRDNRALLEQIAEKTGGRVLKMGVAQGVDAFDRTALPIPESQKRMWDLMAILAAVFFLLDVAVRRVAVDWKGAREGVEGVIRVREAGQGTVEAWRKARSRSGAAVPKAGDAGKPAAGAAPDPLASGPALDVRSEARDDGAATRSREADARSRTAAESGAGGETEPQDTTSRLLRAKQRATGGDASGGAGGQGGGPSGGPSGGPNGGPSGGPNGGTGSGKSGGSGAR